jgi:hypothetical protein
MTNVVERARRHLRENADGDEKDGLIADLLAELEELRGAYLRLMKAIQGKNVEATVIACSSCGKPVEQDQSPWDKREWLCDACHAVVES